jgi:hypothetical protein
MDARWARAQSPDGKRKYPSGGHARGSEAKCPVMRFVGPYVAALDVRTVRGILPLPCRVPGENVMIISHKDHTPQVKAVGE